MANLILSDSDSDFEVLMLLSDWDSEEELFIHSQLSSNNRELEQCSVNPDKSQENLLHPDEDRDEIVSSQPNELVGVSGAKSVQPQNINGSQDRSMRRRRRRKIPHSKRYRNVEKMQYLNDSDFTVRFRLSKTAVDALLTEIMPHVQVTSSRNNGVAPLHQLLLTLRFYAIGAMLESIAEFVGVSKSSASRIVHGISGAIAKLYDKRVIMNEGSDINFYKIAQFPRVLGAIDCIHVRIYSIKHLFGEEYKNRDGCTSLNVQVVCDANHKLMNVVARSPGSIDNDTIFDNSDLRAKCESGSFGNRWLLGNSAYPCRAYLLTPIFKPTTSNELKYNDAHNRTWETIQHTVRLWKRRFPVLDSTIRLNLNNIQNVIIATAVLHNFCLDYNIVDISPEVDLPQDKQNVPAYPQNMEVQDFGQRANLIEYYFKV